MKINSIAYRITSMASGKEHIEHLGPIIAALVEGGNVVLKEEGSKESKVITAGKLT